MKVVNKQTNKQTNQQNKRLSVKEFSIFLTKIPLMKLANTSFINILFRVQFSSRFSLLILDINLARNVHCSQLAIGDPRASRGEQRLQTIFTELRERTMIYLN